MDDKALNDQSKDKGRFTPFDTSDRENAFPRWKPFLVEGCLLERSGKIYFLSYKNEYCQAFNRFFPNSWYSTRQRMDLPFTEFIIWKIFLSCKKPGPGSVCQVRLLIRGASGKEWPRRRNSRSQILHGGKNSDDTGLVSLPYPTRTCFVFQQNDGKNKTGNTENGGKGQGIHIQRIGQTVPDQGSCKHEEDRQYIHLEGGGKQGGCLNADNHTIARFGRDRVKGFHLHFLSGFMGSARPPGGAGFAGRGTDSFHPRRSPAVIQPYDYTFFSRHGNILSIFRQGAPNLNQWKGTSDNRSARIADICRLPSERRIRKNPFPARRKNFLPPPWRAA